MEYEEGRADAPQCVLVRPDFLTVPPQKICANRDCKRECLRVIDGEQKAAHYLARLQAQQADPDELAVIVSGLYGAALRGFCRVIEHALGAQHA